MTQAGDAVFDPFLGAGTSIVAALKHGRRGIGAELSEAYAGIAKERIELQLQGMLKTRPMNLPVFDPAKAGKSLTENPWLADISRTLQRPVAVDDLFAVQA
jgi:adenine-specific DNA-methyltransferase